MSFLETHKEGKNFGIALPSNDLLNFILDYSKESLGSEEESGKDWDELEEEARKGKLCVVSFEAQISNRF